MNDVEVTARYIDRNNPLVHPDSVIIDAHSNKTGRWCRVTIDPLMDGISLEQATKQKMSAIKRVLKPRR